MLESAIFWVVGVASVGAGLAMILSRNAVHAALFLVGIQLGLAVLFLLQGAFFLAVLQIIIYAGAIMVLFVFVVMLLGVDKREVLVEPLSLQRPLAIALGLVLVFQIAYLATSRGLRLPAAAEGPVAGDVETIARVLFTDWVLPFEITGVLLTVAVIGALVLAKGRLGP